MSKVSETIFHGAKHYITSPFGKRAVMNTSKGNTNPFHSGVDYGTNSKKLPQYAIADGIVTSCGQDSAENGYANFVWVEYAKLGYRLLHYHLDSISVKKGQKVTVNTEIGKTGKSGKATGIHLHLGVKKIGSDKWIDPEKFSKDVFEKFLKEQEAGKKKPTTTSKTSTAKKESSFLPSRGYFKKGDVSANVGKIASFMRKTFPSYTSEKALGNTYGDNIIAAITEFQKRTGLKADGNIGAKTLAELKKYGFKE